MPESIVPVVKTAASQYGNIEIDGNLGDWENSERLDNLGSLQVAGYRVFGKKTDRGYVLAIESTQAEIGANTTIWLNADLNRATGYRVFGFAAGAEYNINFDATGTPFLYSGGAGENLIGAVDFAKSSDGKTIEIAIPADLVNTNANGIEAFIDVNDRVFLPGDYQNSLRLDNSSLPQRTSQEKRIAIVYSESSANNYFDKKAYAQLFANAQNQAMQAGIPFDLLSETDLKDLNKLVNYDALVFPSFINVDRANLEAIEANLTKAVAKYGIGLITSGDFMTNDETGAALGGDPYSRMANLIGVRRTSGGGMQTAVVTARDTNNNILGASGYSAGDRLANYDNGTAFAVYNPVGTGSILAEQTVNGANYNAIISTKTGGQNVHFANQSFLADSNILGQAIEGIVYGDKPRVSLDLTRNNSLFLSRDDVDLSQYASTAPLVEGQLTTILADWKAKYGFVGSHFINIGNNPAIGETTDWSVMKPIYQQWLALGNEIGTHSYTHPDDPSNLTPTEVEFEFNQSKNVIARQLGINITGAATPGNPDSLALDRQLDNYFRYYTGVGTAYDSAFGSLDPNAQAVYFAPNISFDFNAIGFRKLTNAQTAALWAQEYDRLTDRRHKPIVAFAWHDYGATGYDPAYDPAIYTNFIAKAAADGTEFVTFDDAQNRIRTFKQSRMTIDTNGNTINASVVADGNTAGVGKFSLDIQSNQQIKNVGNYYAFDRDSVLLPKTGGNYTIELGSGADDVTHIVALAQRAELLSVTGNGRDLNFSFNGEGQISIDLNSATTAGFVASGADGYNRSGNRLEMNFNTTTTHTGKITVGATQGTGGNDLLLGSGCNLVGIDVNSATPGKGEIDTLIHSGKGDRIVLGDANRAYYSNDGAADYAQIVGFAAASGDTIQLKGTAADYSLGTAANGTAIYDNTLGRSELIGILENTAGLNLNDSYFQYV